MNTVQPEAARPHPLLRTYRCAQCRRHYPGGPQRDTPPGWVSVRVVRADGTMYIRCLDSRRCAIVFIKKHLRGVNDVPPPGERDVPAHDASLAREESAALAEVQAGLRA